MLQALEKPLIASQIEKWPRNLTETRNLEGGDQVTDEIRGIFSRHETAGFWLKRGAAESVLSVHELTNQQPV